MLAKCLELQSDGVVKSVSVGSTASYGFVFRGISKSLVAMGLQGESVS